MSPLDRDWHPRGKATFPDWKRARPGQRVEHVRTGAQATVIRAVLGKNGRGLHLAVLWDARNGLPAARGNVVAPAFDLRPVGDPPAGS